MQRSPSTEVSFQGLLFMSTQAFGSSRGLWRISRDWSIEVDRSSDVSRRLRAGGCDARPAASRRSALFSNSRQPQRPTMKPSATPANDESYDPCQDFRRVDARGGTAHRDTRNKGERMDYCRRQNGHERDAHQGRASPDPSRQGRRSRRRTATWSRLRGSGKITASHEARLRADQHEGVGGAIGVATAPLRRRRIGVDEQHRR